MKNNAVAINSNKVKNLKKVVKILRGMSVEKLKTQIIIPKKISAKSIIEAMIDSLSENFFI